MNPMNTPPKEFIRVKPDELRSFVAALFHRVNMPEDDAQLLSHLLVASDLRGIHSHGTWQASGYVSQLKAGELNVRPSIRITHETETTAVFDGDGGLGYFPSFRAAHRVVEKAKKFGVGVAVTRNHGHFGAAGHYSRIASAAGCIGISISAVRFVPTAEACVAYAGGGAPISIAIPGGNGPPIVPDMGLYLYYNDGREFEDLFAKLPGAFLKMLGLSAACHVLGGILAGIHGAPPAGAKQFQGANQGAFIAAIDVARFMPPDEFKHHVDVYVAAAQKMKPFPGYDRADLPGTLEWRREHEYSGAGIPISPQHRAALDAVAAELGVHRLGTR